MSASMPAPPLLLGHRGAKGVRSIRENTFRSFDRALEAGCDGFELDVRLSADRRAVVVHDPRYHSLSVASSKFARLQKAIKPRSKKKGSATSDDNGLLCLEQVLARYEPQVFLDIELKVAGLEPTVLEVLRRAGPRHEYVISSFLPNVLWELKARSASFTGMICDRKTQLARWPRIPTEYLILEQKLVTPLLVDELHAAQRRVFVWTVNTPARMRRMADWGVDGIISDYPDLLVETLRPRSRPQEN
jgi:glycerophosphoryl diester phosphodiesterase